MTNNTTSEEVITSPKIRRLERLLEEKRSKTTLKEKIKGREEMLEIMVYGFPSMEKWSEARNRGKTKLSTPTP